MDLKYHFNVFICILYTASFWVEADDDSGEDDSCEDSNSSDYDTLCEQYLGITRCMKHYGPVCGSNGVTYRSEYHLAIAACSFGRNSPSIRVAYRGSCVRISRPPVIQTRPPPPARDRCAFRCPSGEPFVCGSDGVVYESRCHLAEVNCYLNTRITVRKEGFCESNPSTTRTTPAPAIKVTTPLPTTSTTPVVATIRTTLPMAPTTVPTTVMTTPTPTRRTPRQFGGDNTPQPGRGDTPCNDNCPDGPADGSAAVCGTNGETYETECHLLVKQCQEDRTLVVASSGPCPQTQRQCPPTSICPTEYLPICGTGNITYPSLCHFQIAACRAKDETRKVLLAGECPQKSDPSCPTCGPEINEVCGTDNMTYTSECALKEISCRFNLPDLTVAHLGQCLNQECPDACADVVDPVCATNGKTYSSLCALSVEACKLKDTPPTVAYRGTCSSADFCSVECPDIYQPLCDNKGTTYQNACQLWIAICKDPGLTRKLDQEGCNLAIP